jgi:hypothetical protein
MLTEHQQNSASAGDPPLPNLRAGTVFTLADKGCVGLGRRAIGRHIHRGAQIFPQLPCGSYETATFARSC